MDFRKINFVLNSNTQAKMEKLKKVKDIADALEEAIKEFNDTDILITIKEQDVPSNGR